MQQPQNMMTAMGSFHPPHITTEQIQKYLDENKKLILAILDNQNLGKLAECAQYQAQLQKNLMYLAAIADSQPQVPAMPTQMTTAVSQHPVIPQGGYYMPPQGTPMTQQSSDFASKMQMQLQMQFAASPHQQQQQQQLLHQQAMKGQMNARSMQSEMGLGGVGGSGGQNRQSAAHEAGHGSDVPGSSGGGNGGGDEGAALGK